MIAANEVDELIDSLTSYGSDETKRAARNRLRDGLRKARALEAESEGLKRLLEEQAVTLGRVVARAQFDAARAEELNGLHLEAIRQRTIQIEDLETLVEELRGEIAAAEPKGETKGKQR